MDFTGYPKVANVDYPPPQDMPSYPDQFDKDYLSDAFSASPDYSVNTFFDAESFSNRPLTSVEMSSSFPPKSHGMFNPTLPATGISASGTAPPPFRHSFSTAPFGQLEQYPSGFALSTAQVNPTEPACVSPETYKSSQTPSLCGDMPQPAQSPSFSPHNLKRESPSSPTSVSDKSTPKRPLRKRGRPRLDHSSADSHSTTPSSAKCQRSGRLPHNQVERKYREGLNSELERLRRAVPTLSQSDEGGVMGQPKPSKAMVLSSAIEYIRRIEKERDALKEENERLRQAHGHGSGGNNELWMRGNTSMEEFLMDP